MDGLYNTTKNLLNPESRVISGSFSINSANSSPTKTNIDYLKSSLNDRDIGRLNYNAIGISCLKQAAEMEHPGAKFIVAAVQDDPGKLNDAFRITSMAKIFRLFLSEIAYS